MKGCKKLSQGEIDLIKSNLSPIHKAIFVIGIRTGFRISEILSLTPSDIREDVSLKKRNTKGKIEGRIVPLHPEIRECLDKLNLNPDSREIIFPINKSTYWRALKRACVDAGLSSDRISSHATRKTYAQTVLEITNGNIWQMQKAMGHKSINSTAQYIDVDMDGVWMAIKNQK